ncbi:MAG: CBS domain-containing protein [Anaerolinea sp.]|nr:CBS domain-containing protein [Anaerolinea sp.]
MMLEKLPWSALKSVVIDEVQHAVGVITEGDLVVRVSPAERPRILQMLGSRIAGTARGQITARDLMSEKALSAPPHMTITEAISLLLREGRKQLVVIDDQGHIVGIVDRQMLMAACMGG